MNDHNVYGNNNHQGLFSMKCNLKKLDKQYEMRYERMQNNINELLTLSLKQILKESTDADEYRNIKRVDLNVNRHEKQMNGYHIEFHHGCDDIRNGLETNEENEIHSNVAGTTNEHIENGRARIVHAIQNMIDLSKSQYHNELMEMKMNVEAKKKLLFGNYNRLFTKEECKESQALG